MLYNDIQKDKIDGELLHGMLLGGFSSLSHNDEYLNELNVFPVSDKDTGSNMKLTFEKGIAAIDEDMHGFDTLFYSFVKGMSIGSRGNSGFLLSQYFLGIYEHIKNRDSAALTDLVAALQHAYRVAYRAVLQPAEGTMLTVMRESIERTLPKLNYKESMKDFFDILVEEMFFCVQETITQMDILSENNVVDSGALGLYLIFDGMRRVLHGDRQHFDCSQSALLPKRATGLTKPVSFFRYCTEFVIRLKKERQRDKDYFVGLLEKKGDSLVVAINENLLKVHIHSNEPHKIIDVFSKFGDFAVKKVDDLFQTEELDRLRIRKHQGFAVVAFVCGEGNAGIIEQLGADVAFSVPHGHDSSENELKGLLGEFLSENLIVFAHDKKTKERIKSIKWHSGLQNLYVADTDNLVKMFFMLSSMVFSEEYKNIVKLLESLKKMKTLEKVIKVSMVNNHAQYSSNEGNKTVIKHNLSEVLYEVLTYDILKPYSTVVIFGGKNAKESDIKTMLAYFEKNNNIEFAYLEGKQHGSDFIVGAL